MKSANSLSVTHVLTLSGPIVFSNFAVPLLGAVDTAVIGHTADATAMGAVGVGALVFSFIFWLFGFLKMVTSGLSAQAFGRTHPNTQNQPNELTLVFVRGAILALVISVLILALQVPLLDLAFWWFDLSDTMAHQTVTYLHVRIWAAPATLGTYVILGWLIGVQKTKDLMVLVLFTNLLNIGLDVLFVIGLEMGIAGVAYASLISEYIAFGLGLYFVWRAYPHQTKAIVSHLKAQDFVSLMSSNADIFIRTLCMKIVFLTIAKLGTKMGDATLAANTILLHFFALMAHATDGFAHAAESLTGEALGRGHQQHYRRAFNITLILSLIGALIFSFIYAVFGPWIAIFFTPLPDVLAIFNAHLIWAILLPLSSIVSMHFDGVFIGATRTKEMRNAMIVSTLAFLLVVYPLQSKFANHGLWAAVILFMLFRALSLGFYLPRLFAAVGPTHPK